jgi:outer membrane protein, heavy metal efflux system
MKPFKLLAIAATLLVAGCTYGTRERVDQSVSGMSAQTYDQLPPGPPMNRPGATTALPPVPGASEGVMVTPRAGMDLRTVAWLQGEPAFYQVAGDQQQANQPGQLTPERHVDLNIPAAIPGSDARRIELPRDPVARQREIERLYPPLPPLDAEPIPLAGPCGRPFTLSDFQHIAAVNSAALMQAASDVEAARGNMMQAGAYPNPTLTYQFTPSSDGSTPSTDGVGVSQTIKTGGKLRLSVASAEMALHQAELALKRARSDLSTQVRNAYFAVLVGKETVRVNRALAHFTDEVFRRQVNSLNAGFAAPYEPATLRAQAFTARLAYRQSIQTYYYAWKQLAATINVRQLPLSEVAGRVDATIPFYDYDALLAYILRNHTDVLTAQYGLEAARFNLKLAQVTPIPDVTVNMAVDRDFSVFPGATCPTISVGVPVPVWDRNKGAIIAAEAALIRASEQSHLVEMNLTNTLATAYVGYKSNLEALEYYRRYILPDQVRAYRGTYDRHQIDQGSSFGDVVSAQQTLAGDVTTYLATLASLWTSVTAVADLIQTDDLFEYARPQAVPALPDLDQLPALPCCHPCAQPLGPGDPLSNGAMFPSPEAKRPYQYGPPPTGGPGGPGSAIPAPESLPAPAPMQRPIRNENAPAVSAGSQGG